MVAKDTIKDALMSVLPVPDVEASRQVGRAAVRAMLALAEQCRPGAVLESNFYRTVARRDLLALPRRVIEIFCHCDPATAAGRYRDRDVWNDEVSEPVAGGWPLLEVDTNEPVDVRSVLAFIRAAS